MTSSGEPRRAQEEASQAFGRHAPGGYMGSISMYHVYIGHIGHVGLICSGTLFIFSQFPTDLHLC